MQKLSLVPLLLVTGIGAVWASTLMFPNTNEFPRSPGGAGTISGALALFGANGSAANTDKLNGVTASGYLQNRDCSTEVINKIWVGVDASGRAICGTRGVLLGYLSEGSNISVKRGAATTQTLNLNDPLYAGDIIQTNAGTGTIRFAADESILRLDTSTVVELSVGTLGSNSVAQAILTDGRLWGRILTSTGVNLGGGGMVAGVRGTSVSIERPGTTGPYVISVIDSVIPLEAATLLPVNGTTLTSGTLTHLTAGSQISVYAPTSPAGTNNISNVTSPSPSTTKTTLLDGSAWIRDNTRADIDYLVARSGASDITPANHTRVISEIAATIPPNTDPTILDALCPTLSGQNQIYWKSLIGTSYEKCQDSNLVAFVDRTKSTDIYYQNSKGILNSTSYYALPLGFPSPYSLTVISGKLTVGTTIGIYDSNPDTYLGYISDTTNNTITTQTGSNIYASGSSLQFKIFK